MVDTTPYWVLRIVREHVTVPVHVEIIRFFLSGICHQIPERSLYFGGQPLPLCARCTGTFLGVLTGLLALWAIGRGRRSRLPSRGTMMALLPLVGCWAVDGLNSFLALGSGRGPLYEPNNTLRVVTGLGLGVSLAALLYPIYHYALWREREDEPALGGRWALPILLGAAVAVGSLLLGWRTAPYALWAALATVAAAATLTIANGAMVTLLVRKEGYARRWPEVMPWLLVGLLLSLGETGVLALLRRWLGA